MSSSEDEVKFIPGDNLEIPENAEIAALPSKSKEHYVAAYDNFRTWNSSKKAVNNIDESCLLSYFEDLSEKYKPTTLWAQYSMLKCTININDKVDIGKYSNLLAFLKNKSQGFQKKSFNLFTLKNVKDFISKAPDDVYLTTKVVLILGVAGGCGTEEFVNLKTTDIEEHGRLILVNIPPTKKRKGRSFTVTSKYAEIVKKYINERPVNPDTQRLFLNYSTRSVIGKNKFASMPKEVATFLQLPEPELYTGNSFRRTATILRKQAGCNVLDSQFEEDYEEDSSSVKFEEVLLPIDNIYEEELVPTKRIKLESNSDPKEGNDPLRKVS